MIWPSGIEILGMSSLLWAPGLAVALYRFRWRSDVEVSQLRHNRGFSRQYFGYSSPALIVLLVLTLSSRLLASLIPWPEVLDFLALYGMRLGLMGVGFLQGVASFRWGAYGIGGGIFSGHTYFVLREDVKVLPGIAILEVAVTVAAIVSCFLRLQ